MSEFLSTLWTVVRKAGEGNTTAVTDLVSRYRPAVVRFLRARGLSDADAEDVAQEVFLRLFDDQVLLKADPARGRFRSLLLAVTRHALGHFLEHRQAAKRGAGRAPVPLGDLAARDERDDAFDREFVACLLSVALDRLRRENPAYYEAIHAFLVEERPQREIARAQGETEAAVRNHVARGKAKLAQILREEILTYSSSREEFEAELAYLTKFLDGNSAAK